MQPEERRALSSLEGRNGMARKKKAAIRKKKRAKARKLPKAVVKPETFVLEEQPKSEFLEQKPAPPEEKIELVMPPPAQRAEKSAPPSHAVAYRPHQRQYAIRAKSSRLFRISVALIASLALGAGMMVVLTQFLHMGFLYALATSAALFVAFLIVFYTVLDPIL